MMDGAGPDDPYRGVDHAPVKSTSQKLAELKCPVERWDNKWLIRSSWPARTTRQTASGTSTTTGVYKFAVNDHDTDLDALVDRTYRAWSAFMDVFGKAER